MLNPGAIRDRPRDRVPDPVLPFDRRRPSELLRDAPRSA